MQRAHNEVFYTRAGRKMVNVGVTKQKYREACQADGCSNPLVYTCIQARPTLCPEHQESLRKSGTESNGIGETSDPSASS
jgi:hypothetical protein